MHECVYPVRAVETGDSCVAKADGPKAMQSTPPIPQLVVFVMRHMRLEQANINVISARARINGQGTSRARSRFLGFFVI